jgi:polyisoprenoid-binding protein YceI
MQSGYKFAALVLGVIVGAEPAFAQEVYVFDTRHSIPTFEVTHLGFSQQRGSFTNLTGKVTLDRAARKGTIDVTIGTASATMSPALLGMVKSEEFLNADKFPTMTYTSSDLVFDGDTVTGANGAFTLLGVTRPLTLKVNNFKCGPNPFNKKPMCGGEATGTLKRSEFGMKAALMAASDEVKISIPFEAARE